MTNTVDEQELSDYLSSDRQWTRTLRIAHTKFKINEAKTAGDHGRMLFYQAVLEALES